jgi:hypothetical protein
VSEEALDAFRPHLHRVAERALKLPGMRQHHVLFDLLFTPEQADEYNAGLLKLQGIARRLANSSARAQDASVALSVLSKLQQYAFLPIRIPQHERIWNPNSSRIVLVSTGTR